MNTIESWWEKILNIGYTESLTLLQHRQLKLVNGLSFVSFSTLFFFVFLTSYRGDYSITLIVLVMMFAITLPAFFLNIKEFC